MAANPIRAAIQRGWEARRLLAMGGPMNGGRALEIGCGRGVGIQIILDTFGASHVDAFDLDPRMVKAAEWRHRHRADRVKVWQGDATHVSQADAHYDAVFDFGIIHHVPSWRQAISEVWRVLKPGGRFYAEEVFGRFVNGFPWPWLLEHPREDRFDAAGFSAGLAAARFRVLKMAESAGYFGWFIADKQPEEQPPGVREAVFASRMMVGSLGAARVTRVGHRRWSDLPMHRLFHGVSLACFVIGTVCFGIFFAQAAWLIVEMPSIDVEQGLRQVAPIQAWGWWFFGLYSAGFVIVYCLSGRPRPAEGEPAAAADDPKAGCG